MRIVVSPAKKMKITTDDFSFIDLPVYIEQAEEILNYMKRMSLQQLQDLWQCNDKIAQLNYQRIHTMDLRKNLTAALFSYEGIQYQYMSPSVLSTQQLMYLQEHLRILSGFYGILKPFDGVVPYRLEMQAKLNVNENKNLYQLWGGRLAEVLSNESDCIINLASKEYSKCIIDHAPPELTLVQCIFGELKNEQIIEKGTLVKMARGEMIRFMAENNVQNMEQLKNFEALKFAFDEKRSTPCRLVFLQ